MSYLEIELTAVDWRNEHLELPVEEANHAFPPTEQPQVAAYPITINIDDLREFYPRRRGRNGTRLVYKNGAGRPVQESYADVRAKIAAAVATLNGGWRGR